MHLFTGSDGQSHFEDFDLPFEPPQCISLTPTKRTSGVFFNRFPAGHELGWNSAPRRQYLVGIAGIAELTLRDGTCKRLGPGDVVLAEDLAGFHHTKFVGDEDRVSLVIPLLD